MRLCQVWALPVICFPSQDHRFIDLLSNPQATVLFSAIGPLYSVLPCLECACTGVKAHTHARMHVHILTYLTPGQANPLHDSLFLRGAFLNATAKIKMLSYAHS